MTRACDLCGAHEPLPLLRSPRLDGPLVRCRGCGLVYVDGRRADFTFAAVDAGRTEALAARVTELGIVRSEVDEAERPWRWEAQRERLAWLSTHADRGALLDVGCSTGSFLTAARTIFDARGIEPDPGTSALARAAGLPVRTGTLEDAVGPDERFDVVTLFHVIEHLDSPHRALRQVRRLLRPGGMVMIETPTVDCLWFRVGRERWRQLIPDHYYFFSRMTLERLLVACGLTPVDYRKVGRRASLRFVADRLRRRGAPCVGQLPRVLRAQPGGTHGLRQPRGHHGRRCRRRACLSASPMVRGVSPPNPPRSFTDASHHRLRHPRPQGAICQDDD